MSILSAGRQINKLINVNYIPWKGDSRLSRCRCENVRFRLCVAWLFSNTGWGCLSFGIQGNVFSQQFQSIPVDLTLESQTQSSANIYQFTLDDLFYGNK